MPTVTIEGVKTFEVEPGQKLVLAIEDAGIDIMHRCGGNARCTTCRVQVVAGEPEPMGELERERLAREAALGPDIRLACQIRVGSDLNVRVLNRAAASGVAAGPRPAD
jgi:ferredoxin